MPEPLTFVTFTINNDFDYSKRKQTLLSQFISAQTAITKQNLNKSEKVAQGKKIEEAITQIAFSYPFRGFITFNKDGTSTLNPNARSIRTTEDAKGIPGTNSKAAIPRNYDTRLLKQQVDEIIFMNSLFTGVLKDGQENIIEAMSLARV